MRTAARFGGSSELHQVDGDRRGEALQRGVEEKLVGRIWGWCAIVVALGGPTVVWGQHDAISHDTLSHESSVFVSSRWRFGAWAAGGTKLMIKTRFGHKYDRALYITAIRAERSIRRFRSWTVDYTADLQPLVVATANRDYREDHLCQPSVPCFYPEDAYVLVPSRHTAYAFGVVPIGLRAHATIVGPLQFAIGLSGGCLYFNRRIPDPDETRFNFTADGNLSFLLQTRLGAVSAGFRQHHISNGNTGRVNPALDSHLLFFGYEVR
jgi:hypothetical protein